MGRSAVDRSNRRVVEVTPFTESRHNYVLVCRDCRNEFSATSGDYFQRGEHDIFTCHDCHNQMGLARRVMIDSHDLMIWGSGLQLLRSVVTVAILKEYGL